MKRLLEIVEDLLFFLIIYFVLFIVFIIFLISSAIKIIKNLFNKAKKIFLYIWSKIKNKRYKEWFLLVLFFLTVIIAIIAIGNCSRQAIMKIGERVNTNTAKIEAKKEEIKPTKDEAIIKPILKELDYYIENDLIISMTKTPKKWKEYWYNDYTLFKNELWVVGGVTVTKENYTFETVNFVFYSPNKGETWTIKWRTDENDSTQFFGTKRIEIERNNVYVLLEVGYSRKWMLFSKDQGETWMVHNEWNPKL